MIEKAKISSANNLIGRAELTSLGENQGNVKSNIQMPQPFVGRGWGMRGGMETDSVVLYDKENVLGYVTDSDFFRDSAEEEAKATFKNDPQYKNLQEGELVLQSKANSLVFLDEIGNISLSTSDGSSFELNKNTDSINQLSVNQVIRTEAAFIRNGLVKRDLRTEKEREDDLFLSSLLVQDFAADEELDVVGVDSSHKVADVGEPLVAIFDANEGDPSILKIPGIKDTPNADKIVDKVVNPAVTEYRIEVNEFADGISSLNVGIDPEELKKGRLAPNLASIFTLGTVVDENGRFPRFDYVFGSGNAKGHGEIWKLPKTNETHSSTDFRVDLKSSVKDKEGLGSERQWIAQGVDSFNTAQMFQLVLNTRGADHEGNIPDASKLGSRWALQVDKEGLTKWNIPAATSLKNESFRAGRSLLWNLDGSLTQAIGKEGSKDLESITGKSDDTKHVNASKTRNGRSWTADFEGNIEMKIGADDLGQSQMIEADGSLSFFYGKHKGRDKAVTSKSDITGVQAPAKSGDRLGSSITGRTEGSVDIALGTDSSSQSLSLVSNGLMRIAVGTDSVNDSFILDASGNIKLIAGGGHKFEMIAFGTPSLVSNIIRLEHGLSKSFIEMDAFGSIRLKSGFTGASEIVLSPAGIIKMTAGTNTFVLDPVGQMSFGGPAAGIDISPTAGVILRTPGGSITLQPTGKVDVAANAGFAVTGTFAHLNTTATSLTPGGATSPYGVAVSGPGFSESLTGLSTGGSSTLKV